jgi:hypothetical protein
MLIYKYFAKAQNSCEVVEYDTEAIYSLENGKLSVIMTYVIKVKGALPACHI